MHSGCATTRTVRRTRRMTLTSARHACAACAHARRPIAARRLVERLREDGRASVTALAARPRRDAVDDPPRPRTASPTRGALVRTYGGAALVGRALAAAPRRSARGRQAGDRARPPRRSSSDGATIAIGSGSHDPRVRPRARRPPAHGDHQRPRRGQRPARPRRDRADRPRRRRATPDALDAGPPRRAGDRGAAGRHAVHGHRGDQRRSGPHERLGPRDPHGPRAAPDGPLACVVLADASKFEQVAPGYVFGLEEVDVLVTDDAARPPSTRASPGVQVVAAAAAAVTHGRRRTAAAGMAR